MFTLSQIENHIASFKAEYGYKGAIGTELFYRFNELRQEEDFSYYGTNVSFSVLNFVRFIDYRGATLFVILEDGIIEGPIAVLDYESSKVFTITRTFEGKKVKSIEEFKKFLPLDPKKYFIERPNGCIADLLYYSDERYALNVPIWDFVDEYYLDGIGLKIDRVLNHLILQISYQVKSGSDNYNCKYKEIKIDLVTFEGCK